MRCKINFNMFWIIAYSHFYKHSILFTTYELHIHEKHIIDMLALFITLVDKQILNWFNQFLDM